MRRLLSTAAAILLASFVTFAEARAQISLSSSGGATIGATTTMTVSATPGTQFLLIVSLNGGPTPLPPPHQPSSLDVGFDLVAYFSIPPFLGTVGASPTNIPLLIPALPAIDALTLHFQAVRIVGPRIDGKSNAWLLTPAFSEEVEPTLGTMSQRRASLQLIREPSGSVLVIGGGADGIVASYGQRGIDRYDPGTQTFTHIADMQRPRSGHTATQLLDGRILIAGGAEDVNGEPQATAEIFNPTTLVSTPVGSMATKRGLHTASLLPDGRVLIVGGTTSYANPAAIILGAQSSTEIFNPATNTFSAGPSTPTGIIGHTATTLLNNKVLIIGGYQNTLSISNKALLYTPVNGAMGSFSSAITMNSDRFGHAAVRLPNGDVVIGGGAIDAGFLNSQATASVELFHAATSTFTPDGLLSVARGALAGALLPSGDVVFAGGATGSVATPTGDATVDVYQPGTGALLSSTVCMHSRGYGAAIPLLDGTVLIVGGGEDTSGGSPISWDDAELFHP